VLKRPCCPVNARRDGDGTVPLPSLQVCEDWKAVAAQAGAAVPRNSSNDGSSGSLSGSKQPATHVRRYPGMRHTDIIHSGAAFADVLEALLKLGSAAVESHSSAA